VGLAKPTAGMGLLDEGVCFFFFWSLLGLLAGVFWYYIYFDLVQLCSFLFFAFLLK
jgi:hypothetical protein